MIYIVCHLSCVKTNLKGTIALAARNDVTGDEIKSKTNNKQYADNWDRIFGNKNKPEEKPGTIGPIDKKEEST